MARYRPYAPRDPGTLFDCLKRGIDQLGGVRKAADVIGRTEDWLDSAANPYREEDKRGKVSLAEAAAMCRAGATAPAEYLALLCGGQLLPPIALETPKAIQGALGDIARESGEAIAEIIQRAADGEIDVPDAKAGLKEIDDLLRAAMVVRAAFVQVIETGEPLK